MKSTLYCGDCLELMNRIPNSSIDMVLSDLPYGTTRCRWDTPINLQELWEQYRRVVKENGAIVLFSAQPFTTELIGSNKAMYRYEWIWRKTQPSGFMNAKKMPLRAHENIEIFYRKPPTYNPQMTHGHQRKTATAYGTRESDGSSCYGREERNYTYDSTDRYPVDVLQYSTGDKAKRLHPTQKPVDLLEYLVKTYTNPGETVLDNCMEMQAVLEAMKSITDKTIPVEVYSDSNYVVETMNGHFAMKKNRDLWRKLMRERQKFTSIRFIWVKGHDKNQHNNDVDRQAVAESRKALEAQQG